MPGEIDKLRELGKTEPVAEFLDMKLVELSPGHARVSMAMKKEYINFNGMIFGGIISAVADQAFAYATNSVDNDDRFSGQFRNLVLNDMRIRRM